MHPFSDSIGSIHSQCTSYYVVPHLVNVPHLTENHFQPIPPISDDSFPVNASYLKLLHSWQIQPISDFSIPCHCAPLRAFLTWPIPFLDPCTPSYTAQLLVNAPPLKPLCIWQMHTCIHLTLLASWSIHPISACSAPSHYNPSDL